MTSHRADRRITVLGSFIADVTVRTPALPRWGETVFGSHLRISAGGKGSNQAVAAARLGARVSFLTALGRDAFADLARRTWLAEGVDASLCAGLDGVGTGAATVIVHASRGENAIVVDPGSGLHLTIEHVERAAALIAGSAVFVTQLEVPIPVVARALAIARAGGAITILNAAPARDLPAEVYPLCDYLTPNEVEAQQLTGVAVTTADDAARAAEVLLSRGVGAVIVTLGALGALVRTADLVEHVSAVDAGPVVETTGAGDAFTGALAVGLAEGMDVVRATRFACTAAGISVTRPGTSESMPTRAEVVRLERPA